MYQITVSEEIKNACPIFKGAAVTGLISHGPDHHAGVVLVPDHGTLHPVQDRFCPIRIPGKELVFFVVAVGAK